MLLQQVLASTLPIILYILNLAWVYYNNSQSGMHKPTTEN